jgi:hypothetical protein
MKNSARFFSFVLLTIFIACAILQFLAAGEIRALMLNADALNIPTVVDNLMSHGGSLSHWYLSPAPYLFPDVPMHVIIHPFTSNMYVRLAVFAAVQIVLLFIVVWRLAVHTLRNHPVVIAVVITGTLTWMSVLRGGPYDQLMTAGFHYGAFLISLAVATLSLSNAHQYGRWCAIAALCFLTSLSDNIFVIQTTIPLVLTLVLVAVCDGEHRVIRLITAGVTAFSSLIGSFSYDLFITHDTRYPIHLNADKFLVNGDGVRDVVVELFRNHKIISLALVISALLATRYCFRLATRSHPTTPFAILSIFAFASIASTCVGLVLATTNEMTIRYFIPVFLWPVIISGLFIFNTDLFGRKLSFLVASISALVFSINTSVIVNANGIENTYYPADIACIDLALPPNREVRGMANYWDAKYIQAFSKRDLTLAQYLDILMPMKWITSEDYFHNSYDFAIISTTSPPVYTLSRELLVKKYGEPVSSSTCGTRIVLVFQQGE